MTQQFFWNWFYNSSLILWSRLNVLAGCVILVMTTTDMSPWIPAKYLPIWIVINNVVSEYLRRANTETKNIVVATPQGVMSDVTYLSPPDPVPQGSTLLQVKAATPVSRGYSGYVMFGMVGLMFAVVVGLFALINQIFK